MTNLPKRLPEDDALLGERIRYLGDVQRLTLKHDDVIVITIPGFVSAGVEAAMRQRLHKMLGTRRNILILDGGMRLGVVAAEAQSD